jgi:predicted amidophosphoribosyltransferase
VALFLKDLAADPTLLDKLRGPKPACSGCGGELNHGFCEDCPYEALGKLVEEHPISSAGFRRS